MKEKKEVKQITINQENNIRKPLHSGHCLRDSSISNIEKMVDASLFLSELIEKRKSNNKI